MFFPDPQHLIPDEIPTKKEGKNCCLTFFCSHKVYKIENILFARIQTKFLAN
jgi:hypothetical protein